MSAAIPAAVARPKKLVRAEASSPPAKVGIPPHAPVAATESATRGEARSGANFFNPKIRASAAVAEHMAGSRTDAALPAQKGPAPKQNKQYLRQLRALEMAAWEAADRKEEIVSNAAALRRYERESLEASSLEKWLFVPIIAAGMLALWISAGATGQLVENWNAFVQLVTRFLG
ncbi:MAG: hypothetical protein AB1813_19480 [Verrucomicrobiota bacterium]